MVMTKRWPILAYDCVNGLTYIGERLEGVGKDHLIDYVVVRSDSLLTSQYDDYCTLALRYYYKLPKTESLVLLGQHVAFHRLELQVEQDLFEHRKKRMNKSIQTVI